MDRNRNHGTPQEIKLEAEAGGGTTWEVKAGGGTIWGVELEAEAEGGITQEAKLEASARGRLRHWSRCLSLLGGRLG